MVTALKKLRIAAFLFLCSTAAAALANTASSLGGGSANLLHPVYQALPTGAGPQTNDPGRVSKTDIPSFKKVSSEDSRATKEELLDLWDAALVASHDVRFVVERMTPKKERIKSGGMVRDLSQAMYGCIVAGEGLVKGMSTEGKESAGTKMIVNVLSQHQKAADRKAAVSENDAIILYKMIRDMAGKITTNYYNYKKYMNAIERAHVDLADLTAMVNESRPKQDPSAKLELDYLLRKAQREIDSMQAMMDRCRRELVTLCGTEAVDKVDVLLAEESSSELAPQLVTEPEQPDQSSPPADNQKYPF